MGQRRLECQETSLSLSNIIYTDFVLRFKFEIKCTTLEISSNSVMDWNVK